MCERITSLPQFEPTKEDNSLTTSVRKYLISRNNLTAEVFSSENGIIVTVNAKKIKNINGRITIAPIQEPWNEIVLSPESLNYAIRIASRSHLSEFYILKVEPYDAEITPIKIVIKITTKGIPEDRDDHIFRSLIDTRDKFFNYVEMMITDRPQELAAMMLPGKSGLSGTASFENHRTRALYESLLRIAATNPERLEDVQELVDRLGGKVVPESFAQMCTKFKQSIKKIR